MKLSGGAFAVAFSAGLWVLFPQWLPLALAMLCALVWWMGNAAVKEWCRTLAIALLVVGLRFVPVPWQLDSSMSRSPASARISFQVVGDPTPLSSTRSETQVKIPGKASLLHHGENVSRVFDRISIVLPEKALPETFPVGSRWIASGVLVEKQDAHVGLTPSQWRFVVDDGTLSPKSSASLPSFSQVLFQMRDRLSDHLEQSLPDDGEEQAVLQALLLGNRGALSPAAMDQFARTGLIHVFAISGLHIGMFTLMCWWILRLCGVTLRTRMWWILPILVIFVWISGARASALRALIMIACSLAAPFWYRKIHLRNALYLACIILLILAPWQILDAGFQFSFLLTAGLLCFVQQDVTYLLGRIAPDPWAPKQAFQTWRHRTLWPVLISALVVSAWSMVLSAPLTSYHFNLLSPAGFLGNLFAVPLAFLVLLTGLPALLVSLLPVPGIEGLLLVPVGVARLLLNGSGWLDQLPWGWNWIAQPSLWMILLMYLLLAIPWVLPTWKRPCLLGVLCLWAMFGAQRWWDFSSSEFIILPADRGQAFFLRKGGEQGVLVDVGSAWSGGRIARELKQRGIDRVDAVFFSHSDRFHIGGWPFLKQDLHTDQRFASFLDVQDIGKTTGEATISPIEEGDVLHCGGWKVEVLHPSSHMGGFSADSRSLVLRMTSGMESFLFLGGAGEHVERQLMKTYPDLSARWICSGHPRSDRMMNEAFLKRTNPERVVFSGHTFQGISPERRAAEQRTHALGIQVIKGERATATHVVLAD